MYYVYDRVDMYVYYCEHCEQVLQEVDDDSCIDVAIIQINRQDGLYTLYPVLGVSDKRP